MVQYAEDISQMWFVICGDYLPSIAITGPLTIPGCSPGFRSMNFCTGVSCCTGCVSGQLETYYKRLAKLVHHGATAVFRMKPSQDDRDESPKSEFFCTNHHLMNNQ